MESASGSRFFRACFALFSFAAAIFVGFYGLWVLDVSVNGHGSPGGNALLFALGFILLLLSSVTFFIGAVYLTHHGVLRETKTHE
jgi:hypothetical protein